MIKKFLKRFFDKKFLKFIIVGVINTLVGWTIMFSLYNLGCDYWFSSAANYVLTSILSFFLNKRFTFNSKASSWKSALRFAVNIAVCYGIAFKVAQPLAAMALSSHSETIREKVAMLIGSCLFVGLNYIGQRFFAFSDTDRKKGLGGAAEISQSGNPADTQSGNPADTQSGNPADTQSGNPADIK